MLTMNPLTEEGFGSRWTPLLNADGEQVRKDGKLKYKPWAGDKEMVKEWRKLWADVANKHLAQAGHEVRIDHRSYQEQGLELSPTEHIGVRASNINREAEEQGIRVNLDRIREQEETRKENVQRLVRRPALVLEGITREKSTFDDRDIARYLHRYIDDPALFTDLMARVKQSPELVTIVAASQDPVTGKKLPERYATREMIKLESVMAKQAIHLSTTGSFGVSEKIKSEIIAAHPIMSDEQRAGIERLTGDERISAIVGRAGAGKTTMMKAAREAWEKAGYNVRGAALAGKAAEGLEKEAGIPSRTLASWQLQWENGNLLLDRNSVFVIDEAGMVSSKQMAHFVSAVAHSGAKLVLIGDADQLQPIEAGAAFRSITDNIGYAELATIYRQKERWMTLASFDLASGRIGSALERYGERDAIVFGSSKNDATMKLIKDWSAEYDKADVPLILAHLRRDVRKLNELARSELIAKGEITAGHRFQTEDGPRNIAVGEQVVFLKNDPELNVKNGMIGQVVEAGPGRVVAEVGEDKMRVTIDQTEYRNIDHGYATTIHKSQGVTVNKVKVLASKSLDRHLSYVALTRHREDLKLYSGTESLQSKLSGRLVGYGNARFDNRPENAMSYYATLENQAGERHTVWGAGLSDAIKMQGFEVGQEVALKRLGSQPVTLPDGSQVAKTEWHCELLNSFVTKRLADQMSRAGAKDTTLDYASSQLYDEAKAYAFSRGMYGVRVMKAYAENQLKWVREQRERLKAAGDKLVDIIKRVGQVARSPEKARQPELRPEPILGGAVNWPVGIAATVEAKLKSDRSITHAHTSVAERLRYIYVKPDDALKALQLDRFTNLAGDERAKAQEQLGSSLEQDPVRFGQIHGKAGTFVSKAAKQQRADALGHVPVLVKDINNYLRVHSMALEKEKAVVEQDRKQSQVNIPALSKAAADTLMKVRAAIDAGKPDEALAIASADKGVKAELDGLNKAVTSRFGESAFLHSAAAEGKALDAVKGRIGGDQLQKLTDAWPTLHAAQKLAAAQRTDKQIQSQKQAQAQSQGQGVSR